MTMTTTTTPAREAELRSPARRACPRLFSSALAGLRAMTTPGSARWEAGTNTRVGYACTGVWGLTRRGRRPSSGYSRRRLHQRCARANRRERRASCAAVVRRAAPVRSPDRAVSKSFVHPAGLGTVGPASPCMWLDALASTSGGFVPYIHRMSVEACEIQHIELQTAISRL